MAYRMTEPCSAHALSPSVSQCSQCRRAMCCGCESFFGAVVRCDGCERAVVRRAQLVAHVSSACLVLLGIVASLSTGIVLGLSR